MNWLPLVVSLLGVITSIGAVFWRGGQTDQKIIHVIELAKAMAEHVEKIPVIQQRLIPLEKMKSDYPELSSSVKVMGKSIEELEKRIKSLRDMPAVPRARAPSFPGEYGKFRKDGDE